MYDDVCLFVRISRIQNLSVAAREIGISQPTLSKKIAALELTLGATLVNRDSRNFKLSQLGLEICDNFNNIESEISHLIGIQINKPICIIDDLMLFVRLVDCGSYLKCSQVIEIPKSTLSRRIRSLEGHLAYQLLDRNAHKVELTAEGKILFEKFKKYPAKLAKSWSHILSKSKKIEGILNISLPHSLACCYIFPHLGEFLYKYPDLKINIEHNFREFNIKNHQYDIAITNYIPKQQTQKIRTLVSDKIIVVCTKEYIARHGLLSELNQTQAHLFPSKLNPNSEELPVIHLYEENSENVVTIPNPYRLRVNNFMASKNMVKSNEAIAGLPYHLIQEELQSGEFVRVLPNYHVGVMSYYLLLNIDRGDVKLKAFLKFLDKCIKLVNEHCVVGSSNHRHSYFVV